ncbi:hypothetical protein AAEP80_13280 [Curtobacterium sp. L3-7]|uniref:hypothetical protein n=1 Tax=Curtobacterium sp. L3-7 TaxID=3138787 RepID=UPI003B52F676
MDTALIAAGIAAPAAIAAAVVSWFGAFQSRRTADRHHAWERFVWALEARRGSLEYDISKTVLQNLEDVTWWSEADRRLARRALRRMIANDHGASAEDSSTPRKDHPR